MTMPRSCNLDNMRAWIVALESGEFEQTTGVLRLVSKAGTSYCCLGVATELATTAGIKPNDLNYVTGRCINEDHHSIHDFWCQLQEEMLPDEVVAHLGIDSTDPVLYVAEPDDERNENDTASEFNDAGESFRRIAWRLRHTYLPEGEWVERPED